MDLQHQPHHDGSPHYVRVPSGDDLPVATPELGGMVVLRIEVPHAAGVDTVHVRSTPDAEPRFGIARRVVSGDHVDLWEAEVEATNPTTRYRFELDGPGGVRWLTQLGVVDHEVPDTWDFALVAEPMAPAWAADGVLYQIFPDRFERAGASPAWPDWAQQASWDDPVATTPPASMVQLYGGDLHGIAARVGHLVDLGVTGVYLNPVFPAPENHRYCASDFGHVDPFLGGDEALVALSRVLHDAGLRLIGDLTLNHSGHTHPWFVSALADRDSTEAGFYAWIDREAGEYHAWVGVPTLPKFDHRSAELRRRLYEGPDSVAARWLRAPYHLDGWRVDAANMAARSGAVDLNHAMQRRLLATMRSERPDAYLLAEHCHDATADLQGGGWHGTMDYAGFTWAAWSWLQAPGSEVGLLGVPSGVPRRPGASVVRALNLVRAQLPWRSVVHSLSLLSSHDTARWAHVAGDRARRHVGIVWLLTFAGIPSIYYGDEVGLAGTSNESGRQPMPWDRAHWDEQTLALTRRMIELRRGSVALRRGGLRWLYVDDDVLVYLRGHPDERVLVQLTRDGADGVRLDAGALATDHATPLLDHAPLTVEHGALELPATDGPTARVWRLEPLPGRD